MKRRLIAILGLAWVLPLAAQSGGTFRLVWSSIDGGGGKTTGAGALVLTGSVGQPDAAPNTPLTGGTFRLLPGFLAVPDDDRIFANNFE
jgi:hypothetical protein